LPTSTTTTTTASTTTTTTASTTTTLATLDTMPPSVPGTITAAAVSCGQISVSWTASTDTGGSSLRGYNVYVWRNNMWTFLKQVLAPSTSSSDSGLIGSTIYYYAASAFDGAGNESALSVWTSAMTPSCAATTTTTTTSTTSTTAPATTSTTTSTSTTT